MNRIAFECTFPMEDAGRNAPSGNSNLAEYIGGTNQKSAETASPFLPNTIVQEESRPATLPPWLDCGDSDQNPYPGQPPTRPAETVPPPDPQPIAPPRLGPVFRPTEGRFPDVHPYWATAPIPPPLAPPVWGKPRGFGPKEK